MLLGLACYKGVIVGACSHYLDLGTWASLAQVNIFSYELRSSERERGKFYNHSTLFVRLNILGTLIQI